MGKRAGACIAACALVMLAGPVSLAAASVEVGEVFPPTNNCFGGSDGFTRLQTGAPLGQYLVPSAGVITGWSVQTDATSGPLAFRVGRPTGTPNEYLLVGSGPTEPLAPNRVNSFSNLRIPVQEGDVIGHFQPPGTNFNCHRGGAAYSYSYVSGDPGVGTTFTTFTTPNFQADEMAVLEPDCDNDGFGDDTQDQDLSACPPAPVATITKAPKDKVKTKKKRKKVTFAFSSNEPGSTFNCTLDGRQQFKACSSPLKVKVKKGEHTFTVEATDAGGNRGAAASDRFKVKRKKRR